MKQKKNSYVLDRGLRVFRATYRNRAGENVVAAKWYIEFRDHKEIVRRLPGFTERQQTEELARRLAKVVAWKVSGELPDPATSTWLEQLPDALRQSLVRIGLLDRRRVAAGEALEVHLSDWRHALKAKANTHEYVALKVARVRAIVDGCGFATCSDISASAVQRFLHELREGDAERKGISHQTSNFYLQAIKQFCRWMMKDHRAAESPIDHLEPLNTRVDRRHDRRAFSVPEMRWLLEVTRTGKHRFGMSGEDRALLYRLAIETGFRRGELASLTADSFRFFAGYAKARRERSVKLVTEIVPALRERTRLLLPGAAVFRLPSHQRSAKMLRADLAEARKAWLDAATGYEERQKRESSDFCKYRNAAGEFLDFHALRHTRCTWLFEIEGLNPREVQELMGVSSLALVDRYSRSHKRAAEIAIGPGPDLSAPPEFTQQRATGTGGRQADDPDVRLASSRDASGHERSRISVQSETLINTETPAKAGVSSEKLNGEDRTPVELFIATVTANPVSQLRSNHF